MICKSCGRRVPENAVFCDSCGAKIEYAHKKIFCANCGAEMEEGIEFCGNCGAPMHGRYAFEKKAAAPKQQNNIIMLAIIIPLAVVVLIAAIVSFILLNSSDNAIEQTSVPVAEQDTGEAGMNNERNPGYMMPHPVFTRATASSIRGTDTEGGQYSVAAVLNTDNETKWVPSKSSNSGISEWIEIYADSVQYVRGIEILNGYHKTYEIWKNNNRVKSCTITFSNGETRSFFLDDTMDMIRLDLGYVVETTSIRLTINSVYYGNKWDDTAITYLGAY